MLKALGFNCLYESKVLSFVFLLVFFCFSFSNRQPEYTPYAVGFDCVSLFVDDTCDEDIIMSLARGGGLGLMWAWLSA